MSEVITFTSGKGGVGKTTTAVTDEKRCVVGKNNRVD